MKPVRDGLGEMRHLVQIDKTRRSGNATLSIDLDNAWSYLRTAGRSEWTEYPSYLDVLVPRVLKLLERFELRATWFIVGQDAAISSNRAALGLITRGGHEVGNHSHRHHPWSLDERSCEDAKELALAEDSINSATGRVPRGYRAPGHRITRTMLDVLVDRGYAYDASILPTFFGPAMRAYYFMTTGASTEARVERSTLFGHFREGFLPLNPFYWQARNGRLLELPVTTLPVMRLPFHFSYLQFVAGHAPAAARQYLRMALYLCRRAHVTPSLLLHSLDFLGVDDLPGFSFFPGMNRTSGEKMAFVEWALGDIARRYDILTLGQFSDRLRAARTPLPTRRPELLEGRSAA